ncbi:hypothetical protein ABU614_10780 [Lysobacter firmicutimachus]|uniref:Uncharacterized protein n=1 Tax=Lysobacter firmicutimachus TaxID=1792846 RepID=A0AAU8MZ96_9GAMM
MRTIYQRIFRRMPPRKSLEDWPSWALFCLAAVSALEAWYWFQPVNEVAPPYVRAINGGVPIDATALLVGFLLLVLASASLVFGFLFGSAISVLQKRITGET